MRTACADGLKRASQIHGFVDTRIKGLMSRLETNARTPHVSIITPSFNQGRFIEETIKSVISQEGDFYLEYLIMDGGSTDETVEIIKKYDRLIKEGNWPFKCLGIEYRWVSEKDKGQADAVNKGFKAAKGTILGWLNSDDTYLPGAVSKALRYFEENEGVMMVYGEGYHINETGGIIERYYTEPFDREKFACKCFICQPTVFLRRKVLEEVGMLDADLHLCMDYDYWIRISEKLKIGFLPEYLANSRLYPETKTMSKRVEIYREIIKTVKKHYGYVPNSWRYGYLYELLERRLGADSKLKKMLYWTARRILFTYAYLESKGKSLIKRT